MPAHDLSWPSRFKRLLLKPMPTDRCGLATWRPSRDASSKASWSSTG